MRYLIWLVVYFMVSILATGTYLLLRHFKVIKFYPVELDEYEGTEL